MVLMIPVGISISKRKLINLFSNPMFIIVKSTPLKVAEKGKTRIVMAVEITSGESARLAFQGHFLMKQQSILIINMKKSEPWINTITQVVTYIFRCNTDITCLLSGTAIKAVVMYVSDYITKTSLKTHTIFDSIRSVFHKNSEMIGGTLPMKEKARMIMTKIVNVISAKMEMGAPMISMYLLGTLHRSYICSLFLAVICHRGGTRVQRWSGPYESDFGQTERPHHWYFLCVWLYISGARIGTYLTLWMGLQMLSGQTS